MHIDIGLNTCCFTRRWEEPQNWIKLTKEAGFEYFQLDSDMLDPFFSGDREYQIKTAKEVKEYALQYQIEPTAYYTGTASYRFHGIAHSQKAPRLKMKQWIEEAMDIALAAGMTKVGGRFDAYSVETLEDKNRFEKQLQHSVELYRELAAIGKEKGITEIELEQMYVPSLYPYTMQQTEDYLMRLNENNPGCRLSTTVDVGHMASGSYGGTGEDLLYEAWLAKFSPVSEDIHLQQTKRNKSSHNPFTEKDNQEGEIRIEHLLESIRKGHEQYGNQPLAEYLPAVKRNLLILEYIPSTTQTEEEILDNIGESARYLRKFIPKGGIEL